MKTKVFDDKMAVGRGYSRLEDRRLSSGESWIAGEVITPHGIVIVYAQGDTRHDNHSRLDFVHAGRVYMRNFTNKRYSRRGLAKVAKAFAKEISRTQP